MDPVKVEVFMEFPVPTNVPEVRSFMGLARYYRQFVEGFSKIENLITELQKEKQEVCVNPEMHGIISKAQVVVDDHNDTKGP
jgi:hypothetical protein